MSDIAIIITAQKSKYDYCQAQGPTLGPTQGQVKVKVRTWSGRGQVRSISKSNSSSKVGPELYTKIGFHPPPPTTTPSLNECLERRVHSKSCYIIMMDHKMIKDDPG